MQLVFRNVSNDDSEASGEMLASGPRKRKLDVHSSGKEFLASNKRSKSDDNLAFGNQTLIQKLAENLVKGEEKPLVSASLKHFLLVAINIILYIAQPFFHFKSVQNICQMSIFLCTLLAALK